MKEWGHPSIRVLLSYVVTLSQMVILGEMTMNYLQNLA
jgi:hypothetical protein